MLSMHEKVIFLKGVSSFTGLTVEQFERLAEICEEENFAAGDQIFRQDDPGGALYIVINGQVALEREIRCQTDTISLTIVKPNEYFGEMSLFHDSPRSVTATAFRDTMVLKLDNVDFVAFARQNPDLLVELNHILCQRLVEAYDKISEVTRNQKPLELRKLYEKLDF